VRLYLTLPATAAGGNVRLTFENIGWSDYAPYG
jgi:hypothetical protein